MKLDLISVPFGSYGHVYEHYDADQAPRPHRGQRPVHTTRAARQRPLRAAADVLLWRAHQLLPAAVGDADVRHVGRRRECRGRPGNRLAHAVHRAGRVRLAQAHAALRLPRGVRRRGAAARRPGPDAADPAQRGDDRCGQHRPRHRLWPQHRCHRGPGGHGGTGGAARRGDRAGRGRGLRARDRGAAVRGLAGS